MGSGNFPFFISPYCPKSKTRPRGIVQFTKSYKNFLRRILPVKKKDLTLSATPDEKITFLVKRTVKQHLETGRALLEKGRLEEAIEEYNAAVELDPKCGISQFNLGFAYHEDGQYEMAREHYQKAIEIDPSCPYFLEHLARLNFEVLDFSEAARLFQRASTIGNIQSISIGLWGRALFEQAMYEESIDTFQQLLERDQPPTILVGARYWQTMANIKLGRIAAARKLIESLLLQKRADYKVLYDLGENFIEARCLDLARKIFEKISIEREEFILSRLRLEDIRHLEKEIDEMLPGIFEGDEEKLLYQIHALMEIGDERVSRAMLSLLDHPSALVRESITRYQTKYGFHIENELSSLLEDPVDFVRDAAYEYFEKLDNPKYLINMVRGLEDKHVGIRKKSVRFIGRFSSIEMLPRLEMILTCQDNREIIQDIRQAIVSIKKRYQENLDTLFKSSATDFKKTDKKSFLPHWRFWLAILIQGTLIAYFIYVLITRW